ncbi:MAG: HAMP domain-containing sensor histidine kinase [Planctomycetota bacterium]
MRVARSLFLHVCLGGALGAGLGSGLATWSSGQAAATAAREHALDVAWAVGAALPTDSVEAALALRPDAAAKLEAAARRTAGKVGLARSVHLALPRSTGLTAVRLAGEADPDLANDVTTLASQVLHDRQPACGTRTGAIPQLAATPILSSSGVPLAVLVLGYAPTGSTPLSVWPLVIGLFVAAAVASIVRHRFVRAIASIEATTIDPGNPNAPADATALAERVARLAQKASLGETELEQRVRARTLEVTQQSRMQEEQVANTVHELRTPLTTIMASLSILRDGVAETEDERQQFLDNAMTATRHMTFLCNDILDTAAFEAGKLRIDIMPCDVQDLLTEAESIMRPIAMSRDIELRVDAPAEPVAASADRARVLQVVFNLVGNAVKYSRPNGHVVLRAQRAGNCMAFEVEDDGIGVPVAARGHLFTKFSRLHDKDSTVPGTGIGLYLCRILVEHMGGSIGFDEREGGTGSVFWFTLPLPRSSVTPPVGPGVLTSS